VGVYIYKSESIAIRNWKYWNAGWKHSKAMSTARETQECNVGTQNRNRKKNRNRNRNWD